MYIICKNVVYLINTELSSVFFRDVFVLNVHSQVVFIYLRRRADDQAPEFPLTTTVFFPLTDQQHPLLKPVKKYK